MRMRDQIPTLRGMENETVAAMRRDEEIAVEKLHSIWEATKDALRFAVRDEYRRTFRTGNWNGPKARQTGVLIRIEHRAKMLLSNFSHVAFPFIDDVLKHTKRNRKLRLAWMLDQVSPDGIHPMVDGRMMKAREANLTSGAVTAVFGEEARALWKERWGSWLNAYSSALGHNITLGALNESSPDDAAGEVDATRPGSPANDFWEILDRLFRTEVINAQAQASAEFSDENSEMILTEIWQAHADMRVCVDCEANDGQQRDEVEGDEIPLHPYCRCYWRIVPLAWLDFMRGLDPEQAKALDAKGIAPTMMGITDPETGKVGGFTTVDFYDWTGKLVGSY